MESNEYPSVPVYALKIWEDTKKLFDEDPKHLFLEELTQEHTGRLVFSVDGAEFESCFLKKDTRRLMVFLSGPARNNYDIPVFWQKSYSSYFSDSALYIDDPCNKQKKFAPTFFWGDESKSYMDSVLKITAAFQKVYKIANKDVIFIGESNTAFVAMYCASQFDESQCLAISPVIDIRITLEYGNWFGAFRDMFGENFLDYKERIDILPFVLRNQHSKFFITSNLASVPDLPQMKYLFLNLGKDLKLGLNIFGNISIYLFNADFPNAHLFSPTEGFFRCIYLYLKNNNIFDEPYFDFDAIYKSIFWYYRDHEKCRDLDKKNKNLIEKLNVFKSNINNLNNKINNLNNKYNDVKLKLKNTKSSLSYILGRKIIDCVKSNNPFIWLFIPFILLYEYHRYKKLK